MCTCFLAGEQHHPCSTSTRNASQEIKNFRLGKEKLGPTTKPVSLPHKLNWFPHRVHQPSSAEKSTLTQPNHSNLSHNAESIPTSSKSTQLSKEKHCPTTKSTNLSHKAKSVPTPGTSTHCPPPLLHRWYLSSKT